MIQVIDLIETDNEPATISQWSQICSAFADCDGYVSGQLLSRFDQLHPIADFGLISVCQWRSDDAWQQARASVKAQPALQTVIATMPARFTAFKGRLVNGPGFAAANNQNMVLVDVISLPAARVDGYQAMWADAKRFMETKPGYVAASLYRTTDNDNTIKFINIAEWKTVEQFYAALKTTEFFAIIDDFKNDFALYLTRRKVNKPCLQQVKTPA